MALKEKTNSLRSHMLGDWEWYRGIPEEERSMITILKRNSEKRVFDISLFFYSVWL